MRPTYSSRRLSSICIVAASFWALGAEPLMAGPPDLGGILGAAGALLHGPGAVQRAPRPYGGPSRHPKESADDVSERPAKKHDGVDAEAAARTARAFAAIAAENEEIARATRMERERNVDAAVSDFVAELARRHEELLAQGDRAVRATRGEINQVTAGQVRSSIEDAYDKANLHEFERFAGELWTRDRLLVRIVNSAKKGLRPYFEGVGAKGPSTNDLKDLFQKSAADVYAKALETSEIIGVSKSFDRFIRTIYENGDATNDSLWTTGADGQYERLTSIVIETAWQRDFAETGPALMADTQGLDRQFLFRFRARRALYECLSMTYPELLRGGTGAVPTVLTTDAPAPPRGGRTLVPVMSAPAATPAEQQSMWEKVRIHVGKACIGNVTAILASAKSGNIGPVSSREFGLSTGSIPVAPAAERQ